MEKNIKLKLICFTLIMSSCFNAFCQSNVVEAHFKMGDIDFYNAFKVKYDEANANHQIPGCLTSITFARFTVDTFGNIANLAFYENKDTPKVFRELLTYAINASNGNWVPKVVNGKKTESTPFILPFMYMLESGCQTNLRSFNTDTALIHFWNDVIVANSGPFNCVLLSPLVIDSKR